jgi:hypothetical protein
VEEREAGAGPVAGGGSAADASGSWAGFDVSAAGVGVAGAGVGVAGCSGRGGWRAGRRDDLAGGDPSGSALAARLRVLRAFTMAI